MDTNYYQILDVVLGMFVNTKDGQTKQFVARGISTRFQAIINDPKIHFQQGYLNDLYEMGLVTHNGHVSYDSRIYFITNKGLQVLKDGGVSIYFKKIEEKSELEAKVLRATAESHWLNKVQLWVTIILALGTLLGLLFQYLSYQRENEKIRLEIEKLKIELNKN